MTQKAYLRDLCLTPKIWFKKTHPDAVLPTCNDESTSTGDSGYDLAAVEDVKIYAGWSTVVPVGLTLADIDPGYWFRIEPRSGLGFKHNIQPHLGVIDNGYRGDMSVKLYNFGPKLYEIKKGDRVAQLIVYRLFKPIMNWADEVEQTDRGDKGLGSSGR